MPRRPTLAAAALEQRGISHFCPASKVTPQPRPLLGGLIVRQAGAHSTALVSGAGQRTCRQLLSGVWAAHRWPMMAARLSSSGSRYGDLGDQRGARRSGVGLPNVAVGVQPPLQPVFGADPGPIAVGEAGPVVGLAPHQQPSGRRLKRNDGSTRVVLFVGQAVANQPRCSIVQSREPQLAAAGWYVLGGGGDALTQGQGAQTEDGRGQDCSLHYALPVESRCQ